MNALPWLIKGVNILSPAFPFFSPIFKIATAAYGAACAMKDVHADADALEERIREIAGILFRLWETTAPTKVSEKCKTFLKRIGKELTRAQSFLTKYDNHGKLVKYLSSTAHTKDLASINGALTQVVTDTALLLGVENREQIVHLDIRISTI
jgi:hypothetical protein